MYYRTTNTASLKQKKTELKEKQQSQQLLFLGSKTNSNILKSYDRHQRKIYKCFFFVLFTKSQISTQLLSIIILVHQVVSSHVK